jgi:uncharacterized protein (TIGR03067 family)
MARWSALCLLLFVTAPALAADEMREPRLSGAWTAVAAQRDGAPASELVGHRIEFEGDRFRVLESGAVLFGGGFTANAEMTPPEIDFTIEDGEAKGQTWLGIFKTEDGTLAICDNAPDPTAPRPRGFDAFKGSGYVCLEFKR